MDTVLQACPRFEEGEIAAYVACLLQLHRWRKISNDDHRKFATSASIWKKVGKGVGFGLLGGKRMTKDLFCDWMRRLYSFVSAKRGRNCFFCWTIAWHMVGQDVFPSYGLLRNILSHRMPRAKSNRGMQASSQHWNNTIDVALSSVFFWQHGRWGKNHLQLACSNCEAVGGRGMDTSETWNDWK